MTEKKKTAKKPIPLPPKSKPADDRIAKAEKALRAPKTPKPAEPKVKAAPAQPECYGEAYKPDDTDCQQCDLAEGCSAEMVDRQEAASSEAEPEPPASEPDDVVEPEVLDPEPSQAVSVGGNVPKDISAYIQEAAQEDLPLDQEIVKIKALQQNLGLNGYIIGVRLVKIEASQRFKETGEYKTFDDFCVRGVGISRQTAWRMVRVANNFSPEDVAKLGTHKLDIMLKLPAPEKTTYPKAYPQLWRAAQTISSRDLNRKVQEQLKSVGKVDTRNKRPKTNVSLSKLDGLTGTAMVKKGNEAENEAGIASVDMAEHGLQVHLVLRRNKDGRIYRIDWNTVKV